MSLSSIIIHLIFPNHVEYLTLSVLRREQVSTSVGSHSNFIQVDASVWVCVCNGLYSVCHCCCSCWNACPSLLWPTALSGAKFPHHFHSLTPIRRLFSLVCLYYRASEYWNYRLVAGCKSCTVPLLLRIMFVYRKVYKGNTHLVFRLHRRHQPLKRVSGKTITTPTVAFAMFFRFQPRQRSTASYLNFRLL